MNHKVIRLGGRNYLLFGYTPAKTKEIIESLREFEVEQLADVPQGNIILAKTLSIAIAGNGILSRFKAFFIRRRLIKRATTEELVNASVVAIDLIAASEFYTVSKITQRFNKIIAR